MHRDWALKTLLTASLLAIIFIACITEFQDDNARKLAFL